ncbi:nucleolar protein 58-like [Diaphorina citri]|uniref:Nucleolar protein 58-like n=1 Tax=Diaphorina citri TaxID=121845 RepID=A0A3Q0J6A7_DIACI|nr:nucleolar protein 58-like [Diaphorina citri]
MFSKSKKKLLPSKAKRTSIDQIETRDPTTYDFEKTKSKNLGTKLVDNDNKLAGYEIGDPDTILIEYMEHKNAHKAKSRFQSIYSKRNKSRNHKKETDVKNNESVGCFFCVCKLFKTRDQQNTKLENIRPVRIKSRNAEKDISKTKRFDSKDAAIKNHTERCETHVMKIITVDIQQHKEETIELELNERKVLEPQKQESEERENTNVKVIDIERREESKELEPDETKGNEDEASKEEEKELVKFEVESNEEGITGENSLEVIIETKCAKEQTGEIQEELNTEPIVIYDFEDPPIKEDENELNLSESHDINENPMETKEEEVDLSEAKENGQQPNKLEEKKILDIDQEDNEKELDEVDLKSVDVHDFEELAIKIDENEEVDQQSIETEDPV